MLKRKKFNIILNILERSKEILEDSDESDNEIVAEMLKVCKTSLQLSERPKRPWIKLWRCDRLDKGAHTFVSSNLVSDPPAYKNYLRLTESQFNDLLATISSDIERSNTKLRDAVKPAEKLSLILRFLATGETYKSLSYSTRLSSSFISLAIPEVCEAINKHLGGAYLKMPESIGEWDAIAKEFAIKWQFPNCLGALDGKHIRFQASRRDGAFFYNYKGTNSIVLLALVDANCRFIFVNIGCNGRTNDAGVFLQSPLKKILEERINLPPNAVVGNGRCLPHVIVTDDAFPLKTNILKPYPYHTNIMERKIFNIRLSRARHVVEHAFGILSNRFRVFQTSINLKVETVEKITLTCCILHNLLLTYDINYINSCDITNNENIDVSSNTPFNPRKGDAESVRKQFAAYFNEEGKLDWQYKKL